MYKCNRDTINAVSAIGHKLNLSSKSFGYAGTKDRRGITTQWVTAWKMEPKRLLAACDGIPGIHVGNFSFVKEKLNLGDLSGNHFSIALRGLSADTEDINNAVKSLKQNGFLNYFGTVCLFPIELFLGMQRFGTSSVPTHAVGRAILSSNWKQAVDMIISPRVGGTSLLNSSIVLLSVLDDLNFDKARIFWFNNPNDPAGALKMFPRGCVAERSMLQFFAKNKSSAMDYYGAISSVGFYCVILKVVDTKKFKNDVRSCISILRLEFSMFRTITSIWIKKASNRRSCPSNDDRKCGILNHFYLLAVEF